MSFQQPSFQQPKYKSKYWNKMYLNPSPIAFSILEQTMDESFELACNYELPMICSNKNPDIIPLIIKNIDKINNSIMCERYWYHLSENPNAIEILEKNIDKINWSRLSSNPKAVHLLRQNLDHVYWHNVLHDSSLEGVELALEHLDEFYAERQILSEGNYDANYNEWHLICRNPNAIPLIEINFNKIDWKSLCYNKNAVRILEHHIDKIYWPALEHNINATHLIEYLIKNDLNWLNRVDWYFLSGNSGAVHLLEQYYDYINWRSICHNKNAIHIIEQNLDKIDLIDLVYNPNATHLLVKLDYEQMKKNNTEFAKDLATFVCHPQWIQRFSTKFNMDFQEYLEFVM